MHSRAGTAALARRRLDSRLAPLRDAHDLTRPARGWIKAIREALGLTTAQLALRMGVAQTRVSRIEKDEVGAALTLRTLRQAAEAMNCTLVYALIPNEDLDQMVQRRAEELAKERLARTRHTMGLENQSLTRRDLESEQARIRREILEGDPRALWAPR